MANFSKVLTKIDLERRLSLTADDDEAAFPSFGGEQPVLVQVKDENGDVWRVRLCTMLMRPGNRPKLLIDDSRQFVPRHGLSTGDEINLFWEDHQYTIEVIRKNNRLSRIQHHAFMVDFSKVPTKIDVERRVSLTADDDEAALPPFRGEQPMLLQVKDENGDVWRLRRCTILMRPGNRPKLLIDDLRQFVLRHGLSTGDEINLFWEDHQYKIEVISENNRLSRIQHHAVTVNFSKVLTKIDVERRLSLTADDDEGALPPFRGEQPGLLQVKDEKGDVWSFRRCTMVMRPGIRPKLLIDDSRQFVIHKGLCTGDEINLCWEDDKACGRPDYQYKIEVIRRNRVY